MSPFRIGLHPRAAADIDQVARWWSKNRPAAPGLFLDELDRAFMTIAERPEIGRKVALKAYPNARTYVLPRSGHLIIYNVDADSGTVAVARVRHGKRRPLARPHSR